MDAEHCLLKRQLQILLKEKKSYLQGLKEEQKRSHLEVRRMNTDTERYPLFTKTFNPLKRLQSFNHL